MRTCIFCLRRRELKPVINSRAIWIGVPFAAFLWLMVIFSVLWLR